MRIECPACHFSADVDPAKLPPNGGRARCPRCAEQFRVAPPPAAKAPARRESVTCPKCGTGQDSGDTCRHCGLIFARFRAAPPRQEPVAEAPPAAAGDAAESTSPPFGSGRSDILTWLDEGRLAREHLAEAFAVAGTVPGPKAWRRFLDGLALWIGALFLAAAVIFFFAYNWRSLGRFFRFGIVEALLAAAVLASWRLGVAKMSGKAALMVAALLVGALLALQGQTYQTGADPWELFATWALLVLPWVALSRFSPLWLLLVALLNLAAGFYYHAFAGILGILFGTQELWWTLAALNGAALAAWEVAAARGVAWLNERWSPRLLATASAGYVTLLAVWAIVDDRLGATSLRDFVGYLAWLACAYAVYRRKLRDLYVLALGVLSLVVVVSVFLSHETLTHSEPAGYLVVGTVVLALSAAGGWWLRNVAREVEA